MQCTWVYIPLFLKIFLDFVVVYSLEKRDLEDVYHNAVGP